MVAVEGEAGRLLLIRAVEGKVGVDGPNPDVLA